MISDFQCARTNIGERNSGLFKEAKLNQDRLVSLG